MKRALGSAILLAALLPAAAAAQNTYLAFGDSITAGVGDESTGAKGYPPRLETLLRGAGQTDAVVRNEGVPGERTFEGLTRIDGVLGGVNTLLLMEGSNDVSRRLSPEDTIFDLNQIAIKAEVRGIRVVQATVIPRTPRARVDNVNVANQALNQRIRHQAGIRLRRLADPFEVYSQQPNLYAQFYDPAPDDLVGHPNARGYDAMARTFFEVLTGVDAIPPVLGLSTPPHGDRGVGPNQPIRVDVWDFGAGIDLANTRLLINGTDSGVLPEGDARRATFEVRPATPLRAVVQLTLRARDLGNPARTVDRVVVSYIVAGTVFVPGDFDRDGRVDGHDLSQFARFFGLRLGDAGFTFAYDLNDDNVIDGSDLAVVASNFGRTAS